MMGFTNIGFIANMTSMVLYFLYVMHFDLPGAANTTTNYLGSAFMLTLVGGFVSDAYMNRLNTCLLFGAIELLVNNHANTIYNYCVKLLEVSLWRCRDTC